MAPLSGKRVYKVAFFSFASFKKMFEKKLFPGKITLKSRLLGNENRLFISMDSQEEKVSSFITRELCSVILGFVEKQEPMICDFENDRLICVKNRYDYHSFVPKNDLIPEFQAIPQFLTLYSTRTKENFYAYLRVDKLTLAGFVTKSWVELVIDAILTKTPLLFKTEDDPRDDFRKLTSNVLPVAVPTEIQSVAYFKQ